MSGDPSRSAFVAGATGYTGRAVVETLRARGVAVTAHVRPGSPRLETLGDSFRDVGASVDTTPWDRHALASRLTELRPDVVFALLGITRAGAAREKKRTGVEPSYETIDYGLTVLLLDAISDAGLSPRFVYLSSLGTSATASGSTCGGAGRPRSESARAACRSRSRGRASSPATNATRTAPANESAPQWRVSCSEPRLRSAPSASPNATAAAPTRSSRARSSMRRSTRRRRTARSSPRSSGSRRRHPQDELEAIARPADCVALSAPLEDPGDQRAQDRQAHDDGDLNGRNRVDDAITYCAVDRPASISRAKSRNACISDEASSSS